MKKMWILLWAALITTLLLSSNTMAAYDSIHKVGDLNQWANVDINDSCEHVYTSGANVIYKHGSEEINISTAVSDIAFIQGAPRINNNGKVVFSVWHNSGAKSIWTWTKTGGAIKVVDTTTSYPVLGNTNFSSLAANPDINDDGSVVFNGASSGVAANNNGIWKVNSAGVVSLVANRNNRGAVGYLGFFSYPRINDNGVVSYMASEYSTFNVFLNGGGTPLNPTPANQTAIQSPVLSDSGDVAWSHSNPEGSGYRLQLWFKEAGATAALIADSISGEYKPLTVGAYAINDDSVLFLAQQGSGPKGIYRYDGSVYRWIIGVGSILDGLTITDIALSTDNMSDEGYFTFWAQFSDGTYGVYATPIPAAFWLLGSGLLGLVGLRRKLRK